MNELTVLQAIEKRRSTKHFKKDPIPEIILNAIVDAAAEAPSSWNFQPWRIVLVQSESQKIALANVAWEQPQILEAPVVMVFTASLRGWQQTMKQTLATAQATGAWNEKMSGMVKNMAPKFQEALGSKLREYALKDTMIAATHAALAAESLGLNSCFMNGWDEGGVKKVIGAEGNGDTAIALLLPIGYASETPIHSGRLPRKQVVFVDRLSQPYRFEAKKLRSPREKAMGLVHLPRLIDKVRLAQKGELPGYNYLTTGFDKQLLELLAITPLAFESIIKNTSNDEAVLNWLENNAKKLNSEEKEAFNQRILSIGPTDPQRAARFRFLLDSVDPTRSELNSFAELIDLLEGRI